MRFGVFYEHQLPRPWEDGGEQRLFQDALAQVELADRPGIDYAWEVEHHFLEEYSARLIRRSTCKRRIATATSLIAQKPSPWPGKAW
jgi:hypothetical protein